MANESLLQPSSSLSGPATASLIDDLFDLAASRNLEMMLGKILRMTIGILEAEAGSAMFQTQYLQAVRSGAFRREALDRIQHWEEAIAQRLQQNDSHLPQKAPIPISISKSSGSQLVLVNMPLVQDTRIVGSLSFVLAPGRKITKEQHHLLERMARGLGQMTSLIADLELAHRRLHQISLFYDVGQALVTTFDITKLLAETMELATNVIDAGAASILLIDEERDELVFKVSHGTRGPMLREQRIAMDEGIGGWVAHNGKPVIANNARADARFSNRVDVRTGFLTQSIAAVPLKIKGRTIGVLEVLNKYSGSGFNQEDIQLMSYIATQAAIAIENARLYEQLRAEQEHIVKTQEDFRRELIRNLDGPVNLLPAIEMGLDYLERLSVNANPEVLQNEIGALRNLVRQATRDAKNTLFDLHPFVLENQDLITILKQYVNQLRHANKFTIHFKTVEQIPVYNTKINSAIFSIIQEAINNIQRHANADNVWLSLEDQQGQLLVILRDDGQGFDLNKIDAEAHKRLWFGISNMRERAGLIEAKLHIESRMQAPQRGTVIQLTLPRSSNKSTSHQKGN
jgi:signal transduction histidine kinase